jgi:tryptophan synthase alpha chain
MSSRLSDVFAALRAERRCGLVTYVAAGDPNAERSRDILLALDRAGADVLEVGVPFSEPLADGPVIQRACERALAAGMTLSGALELVASIRDQVSAGIVLFAYANPLYQMGLDTVVRRAAEAGVDGVLALDLPLEEAGPLHARLREAGLDMIFLLSPTTSAPRIRRAAELGSGFLYGISRLGVTGARQQLAGSARALSERVRRETSLPLAVGFGLSHPDHVKDVAEFADAAVVGSALVEVIARGQNAADLLPTVEGFVRWLRSGTGRPETSGLPARSAVANGVPQTGR